MYNKLKSFYNSNKSEFLILYGMRRIGKTYSINEYFKNKNLFNVTGLYKNSSSKQISNFISSINNYFNTTYNLNKVNWNTVFDYLYKNIIKSNDKIIIFLDEISWMYNKNSDFLSQLGLFWNTKGTRLSNLKLIICGSDINFILNKFIITQSEFNFRATYIIKLLPFNLKELKDYLDNNIKKYNYEQIIYLYQVFGGIVFYYSLIDVKLTIEENINNLIFKKNGILNKEFYWLISSIISYPNNYIDILEILSKNPNGMLLINIIKELNKNHGSTILHRLIYLKECEYIIMTNPYYEKRKKIKYKINCEFIDFYLRWIYNNKNKYISWDMIINSSEFYTWRGLAFERLIYKHIDIFIDKLNIKPIHIYYPLIYNNKQYDIVIESKNIMYVLELKYTNKSFIIDKNYDLTLYNKSKDIESISRKEVNIIFITNISIKQNEYSKFYKNILIDVLFTL
jgi:uncharacterized protein